MKRVFIALLSTIVLQGYSQVLEPGVYKANAKGQQLTLRIFDDNKYEMAVFQGRYVAEKDTITFLNRDSNTSAFRIKVNKDAPFSSTLKIKFKVQSLMYASRNIYIGTQKEENAVVEYKPLMDFVKKRAYGYADRQKDFKIDVDKAKYLYFVDANRNATAAVSKFQLDPNDNEIEIDYDGSTLQSIELKGIINPETKKITVMEGNSGRDILEFEKDNGKTDTVAGVKPLSVTTEKNWKKSHGFIEEYEFDSSYLEKRAKSNYNFKHAVIKTYSEGIKSLAKTPEKFLVVVVDEGKEAQKRFSEFLKSNEEATSQAMYKGYNAEKDRFNFYLATEKDKAVISNFKIKDKTALLFLNSNGELLYHTEGTLEDNASLFHSYYSVYDEVKRANEQTKLDKLFANKKASLADFKKAFSDIINIKSNFGYQDIDEAVDTVEATAAAIAVDTAAAVGYDADYLHVENPENLYAMKTPKEAVVAKWNSILDFYSKNTTYDADFIEVCKKELLNVGFTHKLYGGPNLFAESNFKVLDYLYTHYDAILANEEKQRKELVPINEYGDEYSNPDTDYLYNFDGITNTLSSFFQKNTDESLHLHRANQIKLIEYYKVFLKHSGYMLGDFSKYLTRIKETNLNNNAVLFKEYGDYFDSINSKNPSIIESLDDMYQVQKAAYVSWPDFKFDFAMLANNTAWAVVETKERDIATIRAAIKWSEASIKVVKNDIHCLDTLAQLYYMNNEKQKAIATEQLAIDNLNTKDKVRLEEYGAVLEKMKNGTY